MIVVLVVLVVVVALALLPGAVAGPLSWFVLGYVLFRAWPAVRSDVGRLRSVGRRRVRLVRRRRLGAHL